ncbi:outer membrane protein assembly factor BamB [Photobacterium sp. 1_MG-2023]|uniref:outer membrane protein assembly factor BamB n=1 Tax=Photobacterium sp. 1_MG-2023 TaxID=3062646 RepID=UPI0026E2C7B4|nr:outer membrane protein assembly factor BamB [Photobacterium sp. 1_MG-2023]MDO6704632.1 outer membrane protein assembly factor BamB [Photobacterium sp. 1_MG-2023]
MRKRLKQALVLAVAIGVLSGCASEEEAVQMATLPAVTNQFTPVQDWTRSIDDGVQHFYSRLVPVTGYGKLYVASRNGLIEALDPVTGQLVWEHQIDAEESAKLSGGLSVAYNKVFVGSENAEVIALDAETGEEAWRAKVDGEVLAKPLADEGMVMVNTSRGILQAMDAQTGATKWQISSEVPTLTLRGDSAPVSISGGVFWGQANGRLAGAYIQNGQLIWQQPVGQPQGATEIDRLVDVDASPVIDGGRLYTAGYNGNLIAIDLRSGQQVWKRNYSSATDFVIESGVLYLVTAEDHLVAVDIRSGTELWKNSELSYRILSAPAVIGGRLVVGDSLGYLHWLDPLNGEFVAQQQTDGSGISVPPLALNDGYLVVTREGKLSKMHLP